MSAPSTQVVNRKFWRLSTALLFALPILIALACSLSLDNPEARQTQMAVGLQSTYLAEKEATLIFQSTQNALSPTPQDTPLPSPSPAPTSAATIASTEVSAPTQAAISTPEATLTSSAPPAAILLTEWSLQGFISDIQDCYDPDQACWGVLQTPASAMVSSQAVYIDPAWQNPYLVFRHKYHLFLKTWRGHPNQLTGYASVQIDGKWKMLRAYTGTQNWEMASLPLLDYQGSEIIVRFATEYDQNWDFPGGYWYFQEIQIVPDFKAP
ncbi:MAG: hypothetical protein AB1894_29405 [Chloroflexota bacterium]